jgi:streptomycin 6-kinase
LIDRLSVNGCLLDAMYRELASMIRRAMLELPPELIRRILDVHGELGREWLSGLPALVDYCAARWSLTPGAPVSALSYNVVLEAQLPDGKGAILKLGVPHRELDGEAAALRAFRGRGAVRLIDAEEARGVLILERAEPGQSLWEVHDDIATPIAASVMKLLWRRPPPGHRFTTLDSWMHGLDRYRALFRDRSGPLPRAMIDRAELLYSELSAEGETYLLHGDLHHGNMLSARRAPWLAIDPKGVVGARGFEVGAFLRNPVERVASSEDPSLRLRRRVALFSEQLGWPPAVIRDWGFVQSVLSAWWSIEDHGTVDESSLECMRRLASLKV